MPEELGGKDNKNENKKNAKTPPSASGGTFNSIMCPYCGNRFIFRNSSNEKHPEPICTHCHNKIRGLMQI